MNKKMQEQNIIGKITSIGYKIVYKPDKIMKDYNATYNVIYNRKRITNNAAKKLKIPTNEIWISEKWRTYEKYILFHEFEEIKFRASGYNVENAHYLAEMESIKKFSNDPVWREMIVKIHISDVMNITGSTK